MADIRMSVGARLARSLDTAGVLLSGKRPVVPELGQIPLLALVRLRRGWLLAVRDTPAMNGPDIALHVLLASALALAGYDGGGRESMDGVEARLRERDGDEAELGAAAEAAGPLLGPALARAVQEAVRRLGAECSEDASRYGWDVFRACVGRGERGFAPPEDDTAKLSELSCALAHADYALALWREAEGEIQPSFFASLPPLSAAAAAGDEGDAKEPCHPHLAELSAWFPDPETRREDWDAFTDDAQELFIDLYLQMLLPAGCHWNAGPGVSADALPDRLVDDDTLRTVRTKGSVSLALGEIAKDPLGAARAAGGHDARDAAVLALFDGAVLRETSRSFVDRYTNVGRAWPARELRRDIMLGRPRLPYVLRLAKSLWAVSFAEATGRRPLLFGCALDAVVAWTFACGPELPEGLPLGDIYCGHQNSASPEEEGEGAAEGASSSGADEGAGAVSMDWEAAETPPAASGASSSPSSSA